MSVVTLLLPLILIILIDLVFFIVSLVTLIRNKNNPNERHNKIKNRSITIIAITSLIFVIVVLFAFVGWKSQTHQDQNSDSNEHKSVQTSSTSTKKMSKSSITASDSQEHPKLSGSVMTYYGVNMMKSTSWSSLKDNLKDKFDIRIVTEDGVTKYFVNLGNQSNGIYYVLTGNNHDIVSFYDENNVLIKKVRLKDIISYINDTVTQKTLEKIRDNITIVVANQGANLVSDSQSNIEKYVQEIMAYAESKDIGSAFTDNTPWRSLPDIKNIFNGTYHIGLKDNTFSLDSQSGGTAQFSLPIDGYVVFLGGGGVSADQHDPAKLKVSVSDIEDVLNTLNSSQLPDVTVSE